MNRFFPLMMMAVLLAAGPCTESTAPITKQSPKVDSLIGTWRVTSWDGAAMPKELTCVEGANNESRTETVTSYWVQLKDSAKYTQAITFATSPQRGPRTETRDGSYLLFGMDSIWFTDGSTGGQWKVKVSDSVTMQQSHMWVLGCPNVFFQAVFKKDGN